MFEGDPTDVSRYTIWTAPRFLVNTREHQMDKLWTRNLGVNEVVNAGVKACDAMSRAASFTVSHCGATCYKIHQEGTVIITALQCT